jgi:hypothetical protein
MAPVRKVGQLPWGRRDQILDFPGCIGLPPLHLQRAAGLFHDQKTFLLDRRFQH